MRIGDEVRVSTPVSTASAMSNPRICCPNCTSASRIAMIAYFGKHVARFVGVTPGVYDGTTLPSDLLGRPAIKSATRCAGAAYVPPPATNAASSHFLCSAMPASGPSG